MYKLEITITKEHTIIAKDIVILDTNTFSIGNISFIEIQQILVDNGWKSICNHSFKKDDFNKS